MSLQEQSIEYKVYKDRRVASIRFHLKRRAELHEKYEKLRNHCGKAISGTAFTIYLWDTSVPEGMFDIEACFPIDGEVEETDVIKVRSLGEYSVLSKRVQNPAFDKKKLNSAYVSLYTYLFNHGFPINLSPGQLEVHHDNNNPEGKDIEVQVAIHDWLGLLNRNIERVLGEEVRDRVMEGCELLSVETPMEERFNWIKDTLTRLNELTSEDQCYDIVSGCAHIFPKERIKLLREIFVKKLEQTKDFHQAVDAVIENMDLDPTFFEKPQREGYVIHAHKVPGDAEGYKKAKTREEKRKANCHCPIIKRNLDKEMPITYCYCGAGWYRQQWEGITGKPVRIKIIKSLVKGDDECRMDIYLSKED